MPYGHDRIDRGLAPPPLQEPALSQSRQTGPNAPPHVHPPRKPVHRVPVGGAGRSRTPSPSRFEFEPKSPGSPASRDVTDSSGHLRPMSTIGMVTSTDSPGGAGGVPARNPYASSSHPLPYPSGGPPEQSTASTRPQGITRPGNQEHSVPTTESEVPRQHRPWQPYTHDENEYTSAESVQTVPGAPIRPKQSPAGGQAMSGATGEPNMMSLNQPVAPLSVDRHYASGSDPSLSQPDAVKPAPMSQSQMPPPPPQPRTGPYGSPIMNHADRTAQRRSGSVHSSSSGLSGSAPLHAVSSGPAATPAAGPPGSAPGAVQQQSAQNSKASSTIHSRNSVSSRVSGSSGMVNAELGVGIGSAYVKEMRRRSATAWSDVSSKVWGLPIGTSPKGSRPPMSSSSLQSSNAYLRRAMHIKHSHLTPRLLASEVDEDDEDNLGSAFGPRPASVADSGNHLKTPSQVSGVGTDEVSLKASPVIPTAATPNLSRASSTSSTKSVDEGVGKIRLFVANPDSD